ncbi:relaxase/mobilization nuclease domain-containing protein [Arthrobacter sp. Soc17.1.1.1]|uniref:relaxase/mobilization nuclease domain-containing protein n=1 Tax=Arthrobacter sp. Soc17.1.1.1 TaxID=3121277 RepID=UPI002FE4F1A5
MIPNITRGSRMSGLMVYLTSTDADKTKNAHTDPHLVAGDAAIMAWHDNGTISREDALAIAKHLDEPHKKFGVEVLQKDLRWDPVQKRKVDHGQKQADVWHCSLSLRAGDRELTDQEWGDIANEFVDQMGFTETSGKAQCRWAAIDHGVSAGGNHHIHIAVSLVREDGTKASTHGDYRRSQEVCRELEKTHGLEQLSTLRATRGFDRAEPQTAVRNEREMYRASLSRKVRAAATGAVTEAEFVRAGRKSGLLMRPRYEKGTTDVVVGYSVAERPTAGERPIWYGGGKLAGDLGLGQLREQWSDTAEGATEAAAEWNAAARNRKPVTPETTTDTARTPTPELWEKYTAQAKEYADRLHSIPVTDHATWAKAARDASGVFAAWSLHSEATPGPLAATADELSKTAQLRDRRQHSKPVRLPSLAGATMLVLAAGSDSKSAAHAALMVQLIRTSKALYEMHVESRNLRESQNLNRVLMNELRPAYTTLIADLPKAGQGTPAPPAPVSGKTGEPLTPAQIAARGNVPWRPGSAVPTRLPSRTRQESPLVARGEPGPER